MDSPKRLRYDSSLSPSSSSVNTCYQPPVAAASTITPPYFNLEELQEYLILCCIEDNQINSLLENVRSLHNEENLIDAHLENQAILFAINMHGLQNRVEEQEEPVIAFDELSPSSSSSTSSSSEFRAESVLLPSDTGHLQVQEISETSLEHEMEQRGILCAINFHGLHTNHP